MGSRPHFPGGIVTRFYHGPDWQGINPFSEEALQRDAYMQEQAELGEGYQESIQRKLMEPQRPVLAPDPGVNGFHALIVSSELAGASMVKWVYTWDRARPGGVPGNWIVAGTSQTGVPGKDYGNATDGFLAYNLAEFRNNSQVIAYGAPSDVAGEYELIPRAIANTNAVFIVKTTIQGNTGIWFEAANPLEVVCDKGP